MVGWYLSQEFEPDTPGTQVFLAPGPEEKPLALPRSPWVHGRMVRVLGRYWHRFLLAVQEESPASAEVLDSWSGTPDPDESGDHHPDPVEAATVHAALRKASHRVRAAEAVSDADLESLGPYDRNDVAAIGDAVRLVVDEAVRLDAAFLAWPE